MAIYIVLLIFYTLGIFVEKRMFRSNKKTRKLLLWNIFLAVPIWFVVSFRAESVGTDTPVYKALYEHFSMLNLSAAFKLTTMEKGYVFLCNICGSVLNISYIGFQIIITSIILALFIQFIYKYSVNFCFSWFLFITFLGFARMTNVTREMLAVGLSFIALKLILEKRVFQFVVAVILITLIHKSAILLLLILPLLFIKKEYLKKIFTSILCIIVVFFFSDIMYLFVQFTGRYAYLMESDYMSVGGGIAQYFNIVIAFFALYLLGKYKRNSSNNKLHTIKRCVLYEGVYNNTIYEYKIWENYVFLSIIFAFAGLRFGLSDRAGLYFSIINIVICVNGLFSEKKAGIRFLMITGFMILMGGYFIAVMLFRNNWHSIVPYNFYWE